MKASPSAAWVVLETEAQPDGDGRGRSRMRDALRAMTTRAMARAGIGVLEMPSCPDLDGLALRAPAAIAAEHMSGRFLAALADDVADYDDLCPPEAVMRLRVALYEPATEDGPAATTPGAACRLAGAPVLRRVLAASPAVLAVAASEAWFGRLAVARPGETVGFDRVRLDAPGAEATAWIKVPGRSSPPGLLASDAPPMDPTPSPGDPAVPSWTAGPVTTVHGPMTVYGGYVGGNQYNNNYGTNHGFGPGRGGRW